MLPTVPEAHKVAPGQTTRQASAIGSRLLPLQGGHFSSFLNTKPDAVVSKGGKVSCRAAVTAAG